MRRLGELHGVAHVVPGGALLASEPLGIPHLPKRNDLADVIEDDGAVAQQVWQLGNPSLLDRLFVACGVQADRPHMIVQGIDPGRRLYSLS